MTILLYVPKMKKTAPYDLDAQKEYTKRLSRYCKIKQVEVKNTEDLLKKLPSNSFTFHIDPSYPPISSEDFSEKISAIGLSGISDLTFVIGDFRDFQPDEKFSLCTTQVPLGLEITVFYEQLYRAYRILRREPYHK